MNFCSLSFLRLKCHLHVCIHLLIHNIVREIHASSGSRRNPHSSPLYRRIPHSSTTILIFLIPIEQGISVVFPPFRSCVPTDRSSIAVAAPYCIQYTHRGISILWIKKSLFYQYSRHLFTAYPPVIHILGITCGKAVEYDLDKLLIVHTHSPKSLIFRRFFHVDN